MKLVLADPNRLVIESLAVALTRRGFAVVALATSAPEVLARVAEHQPDVCLLATDFPCAAAWMSSGSSSSGIPVSSRSCY